MALSRSTRNNCIIRIFLIIYFFFFVQPFPTGCRLSRCRKHFFSFCCWPKNFVCSRRIVGHDPLNYRCVASAARSQTWPASCYRNSKCQTTKSKECNFRQYINYFFTAAAAFFFFYCILFAGDFPISIASSCFPFTRQYLCSLPSRRAISKGFAIAFHFLETLFSSSETLLCFHCARTKANRRNNGSRSSLGWTSQPVHWR